MTLDVYKHRGQLKRTMEAIEKGALTIGFIGGSITDPRGKNRWPEPVTAWFVKNFPNVRITVENAAIGATGSDLAVFRAERDIVSRNCDLVFVEYAVNDVGEPSEKRFRTREGLLRKILAPGHTDVILTYTFISDMYEDMLNGKMTPSVGEFEELAEHYNLGSVWMGLYAFEQVKQGQLRWEEWIPDGLHPDLRGSLCYAESVYNFLYKELVEKSNHNETEEIYRLPKALNPNNWEGAYVLPFSKVKLNGPWVIRRWSTLQWMDQVIDTAAIGARLSFPFNGRGLALGFDFGKTSSEFRYRIDEGKWVDVYRDKPDWCGDEGWYRLTFITDELLPGDHKFEIEVTHSTKPECRGSNMRLALIGILP